jgi:two-component system, response regulator
MYTFGRPEGDKKLLRQDRTILLIEDSADDERLTLRAIRSTDANIQVIVARDGEEALNLLFGNGTAMLRPALVLLDLKLPKVGGLDILQRLRSNPETRSLPVVVLSSSDERDDIAESYRRGANSYVRKPVNFTEFVDAVHHLHQYWLNVNLQALGD